MRFGGKTHVIPDGFISISVRGRETTMQDHVKLFVKTFSELVPDSPIYEFGSLQVPGQEGFADLRSFRLLEIHPILSLEAFFKFRCRTDRPTRKPGISDLGVRHWNQDER